MGLKVKESALPNELLKIICVLMDVPAPAFIQVPVRSCKDVEPTSQVSLQHCLPGP